MAATPHYHRNRISPQHRRRFETALAVTIDTLAPNATAIASEASDQQQPDLAVAAAKPTPRSTLLGQHHDRRLGAWAYTTTIFQTACIASQPLTPTLPQCGLQLAAVAQTIGAATVMERTARALSTLSNHCPTPLSLKYHGADVTAAGSAAELPSAEKTATGYEIAWKSRIVCTVWTTDNNGNYISNAFGAVSGSDTLEPQLPAGPQWRWKNRTVTVPSARRLRHIDRQRCRRSCTQ